MKVPGKLVAVNDTSLHVLHRAGRKGDGRSTIVFLSGWGTECPVYDFKPLWVLLEDRYDIAVVERPGYGFSGSTECPRDIDTLLEETHAALRGIGLSGPFIVACHSISGLEALRWTQEYPEEVSAIIGLDMAVPSIYETMAVPKSLPLLAGFVRLLRKPAAFVRTKGHPAVRAGLLDKEEQAVMRMVSANQLLSKNVVSEADCVKENARIVAQGKTPEAPVLCLLATGKRSMQSSPAWGTAHREYFGGNSRTTFVELPCGHYIHAEKPEAVACEIVRFLG